MRDLTDVLYTWLSGRQTTSMTLWGLPMLWWGRIGKTLQFLAGCAVVLDIIGPLRLHAIALRASERRRLAVGQVDRMRELAALANVKRAITEYIIVRRPVTIGDRITATNYYWDVSNTSVLLVPRRDWFGYEDLAQLRWETLLDLPTAHDCAERHWLELCDQQAHYVLSRVDEYFLANLPRRERELMDDEDELRRAERRRIRITVVLLVLSIAMTALRGPFLWSPLIGVTTLCSLRSDRIWLWLRTVPVVLPTKLGVALLDRLLTYRRMRWIAFILFVTGFGFDLLTS